MEEKRLFLFQEKKDKSSKLTKNGVNQLIKAIDRTIAGIYSLKQNSLIN